MGTAIACHRRASLPERAAVVSVHTAFLRFVAPVARQSGNPRARSRCLSGPSGLSGPSLSERIEASRLRGGSPQQPAQPELGGVGGSVLSGQTAGWQYPEPKESKSPREAVRGPGLGLGTAEPAGLEGTQVTAWSL
ncbi:hypothetical protein NDU88_010498 [Pleurodeles waltl]|uniref:Uncharacterized protein n=1 Tax=Pleurodeles waltl TaxID=8319 RepID=A0AAV7PV08_PLEWA|nr:hypothetical protein NDU88_010498 [Pleurodeles waltl]